MPASERERRSPRQHVAPPLVWFGLLALVVAAGAVLVEVQVVGRTRQTLESAQAYRRSLELFGIERELVYATERMEAAALRVLTTGTGEEELARWQRVFAEQLDRTERALERFVADRSAGEGAGQRMLAKVRELRRSRELPRTPVDSLNAIYDLYYKSPWVPLTAPEGEWFELCAFIHDLQSATYYPLETLDEYLARRWQHTQSEGTPQVQAYLQSVLAWIDSLEQGPRGDEAVLWELEPILQLERARGFGPPMDALVAGLLAHPGARDVREAAPFLLAHDDQPLHPPEEMVRRMTEYSEVLMEGARRAVELADSAIAARVADARRQRMLARAAAGVSCLLALAVLIGIELRRRRFNRHLLDLAHRDPLTGALNRLGLHSLEAGRLADPAQGAFALLQLDLDNFKVINDSYGHHVGDRALIEFAARCRSVVRSDDTLARIGGDEFVIVLHGLGDPVRSAGDVARRLQASLAEPIDCAGRSLRLRTSIGIASSPGPALFDDLMVEADLALYSAKERGRDRHEVFADSTRRMLVRELPRVLSERRLDCAFQPIVDVETGAVAGVELLARWPDRSVDVPAGKMIETIEWLGQTTDLLRCMVVRVAEAHERLGDLFDGRFWINLSPLDLSAAEAEERLLEILGSSGVPLDCLGVEITESLPIVDFAHTQRVVARLREAGLAVAIDDFGSHNTPLRHLMRWPIDVVKLDRGVIQGIDGDRSRRVLGEAVRAIAEAHGMSVVAEGVETAEELATLRELGIPQAQGYAIARPMPLGDLVRMLEDAAKQAAAVLEADGRVANFPPRAAAAAAWARRPA